MAFRRLRLALLLPILELLVWVWLVPVQTGIVVHRLRNVAGTANVLSGGSGQSRFTVPREQIPDLALNFILREQSRTITNINLPGVLFGTLVSLISFHRLGGHPDMFGIDAWRSLTFPFVALPVWWLLGLVLDRLVQGARISWLVLLIHVFLFLSFQVAIVGILLCPPSDRSDLAWLFPGLTFWTVTFSIAPLLALRKKLVAKT